MKATTWIWLTLLSVNVFGAGAGYVYFKWKNLSLESDLSSCRGSVAAMAAEASERLRFAEADALNNARKVDHERQSFITENTAALERDRVAGDGPLAPVLRNALERVRVRQHKNAATDPD